MTMASDCKDEKTESAIEAEVKDALKKREASKGKPLTVSEKLEITNEIKAKYEKSKKPKLPSYSIAFMVTLNSGRDLYKPHKPVK